MKPKISPSKEKWTKELSELLLSCKTDAELRKNFPNYKIETLRRAQRKMRKQYGEVRFTEAQVFEEKLLSALGKKGAPTVAELADALDRSPRTVQETIERLRERGVKIELSPDQRVELSTELVVKPPQKLNTDDYFGDGKIRFGFVTDTHLVSKYSRLDVLNAIYDIFEREGLKNVYHAGNWIDGEAPFNKYDLYCIGVEAQVRYFLENYPQRKGIVTQILSGDDHEGWYVQRDHIDIGKVMEDRAKAMGRTDLVDIGYMERDFVFRRGDGESVIRVIHAGGGSSYAHSYTSQKYVESLQGGEKPAMVLVGHYHKFDHAYPREVHVVQGGCTQDQTPFMRKKKIQAMVGGCIVEIQQDRHGIFNRVKVEWMPFYDKAYYEYKWK